MHVSIWDWTVAAPDRQIDFCERKKLVSETCRSGKGRTYGEVTGGLNLFDVCNDGSVRRCSSSGNGSRSSTRKAGEQKELQARENDEFEEHGERRWAGLRTTVAGGGLCP